MDPEQALKKQSLPLGSPKMLNELTRYWTPGSLAGVVSVSTGCTVSRGTHTRPHAIKLEKATDVTGLPNSIVCLSANCTSAKSKFPEVKLNMLPVKEMVEPLKPNWV